MSKHTPGPWTAIKAFVAIERVVATDGKSVCSTGNTPSRTREEREANARLIAAAPELLEALKEAIEDCPCSVKERLSGHLTTCRAPQWAEAIAKAEGKS